MKAYCYNTDLNKFGLDIKIQKNHRKIEEYILEVYPQIQKHSFFGFGGALTQASGSVLNKMSKHDSDEVIESYFGHNGIGYQFIRVHIDSCDFCERQYCACTSLSDFENGNYNFKYDEKYIFPWLDSIYRKAGYKVPIMLSPWSPPTYFKENSSRLQGGKLQKEHYQDWADYVSRYIKEYQIRGYNVSMLTLQNEPNAIQTWDSCLFSALEEREFLNNIYVAFKKAGVSGVCVLFWDHNKERLMNRAEEFFSKDRTDNFVAGIAFHGYCGDHFEMLSLYKRKHPDHRIVMSEFCMGYSYAQNYKKQLEIYGHEFINDIYYGADLIIDWNLLLDAKGGPNHVANYCMAPVMANDQYRPGFNMAYHLVKGLSECAGNGSTVLTHSSYRKDLDAVSFMKDDGDISIAILFGDDVDKILNVRIGERVFSLVPEKNTLTILDLEKRDYE